MSHAVGGPKGGPTISTENMANNLAWKNYRAKQKAKRTENQKGAATGGTLTNILQAEEIVVQRLSSEVSGKAQKYSRIGARDFVPFTFSEVTLDNIKKACQSHYCNVIGKKMVCDVLAGEQGPSCKSIVQIPDLKVIHIRFVKGARPSLDAAGAPPGEISDDDDSFPIGILSKKSRLQRRAGANNNVHPSKTETSGFVHSGSRTEPKKSAASFPKSLSVTEMIDLGKLVNRKSGTLIHIFSFDLDKMSWSPVPTDVVMHIEPELLAAGGFRKAFKATVGSLTSKEFSGNSWVMKKYLPAALTSLTKLGMTAEEHTMKVVQMHALAKNLCEKMNEALLKKDVLKEYGELLHFNKVYMGKLEGGESVTVEEFIGGEFVKYMNNTGIVCNSIATDSVGEKAVSFAHYTYEKSRHKLMVVDLQGSGHFLYDPEIASRDWTDKDTTEFMFCAGNLSAKAIDTFLANHTCNRYCEMLGLNE